MKYPQIHVVEKYQQFLKQLTSVGKPPSVDRGFIRKLGYKSSYDDNFVHAVKWLGLAEDKRGGAPTERWARLRSDFGGTLAECLRTSYADLYEFFPDAHLRDTEALTSFFRGTTEVSAEEVERIVNAFTAVRDLARFAPGSEPVASDGIVMATETLKASDAPEKRASERNSHQTQPTVNINIQLQLPSDASGEVYEKFFEAMKKHLSL